MLTILSPAKKKSQDYQGEGIDFTTPQSIPQIKKLISELKQYKQSQLSTLMSISEKLAELNFQRFKDFDPSIFNEENSTPAIFAFQGDAYQSLNVNDFNKKELEFTQKHLVILSGLYGYLRPLDLIQAYRIEMKTLLKTKQSKDLYQFWGDKITEGLNKILEKHDNKTIINLASGEYFKAINIENLDGDIIDVQFKELKNGAYKTIGISAKRARGAMTRYIMKNKIDAPEALHKFNDLNYSYSKKMSSHKTFVFIR